MGDRSRREPFAGAEERDERVLERRRRRCVRRAPAAVPCATTRPWPRMTMRSHRAPTSCITCELKSRHLPCGAQRLQLLAQRAHAHDVEAVRGLVEQDRAGIVHQRARDRRPSSARPARSPARAGRRSRAARACRSAWSTRVSSGAPSSPCRRAVVADILARGEPRVEPARVGQHADALADREPVAHDVGLVHAGRAGVGDEQRGQHRAAAWSCRRRWDRAGR